MSEDIREDEEFENGATVEVEEDQSDDTESSSDEDVTRTNARDKSDGDDELDSYSDSVKRRINQLTAKRKQATEEAQAAIQYAQKVQQENESMKTRLQQVSAGYNTEAEGRLKAQEAQATRAYSEASEAGDYDRAAKAQQALAQIAVAKEKVRNQKGQLERQKQQRDQQQKQQQQQQATQAQAPAPQAAPVRDPKLEGWLGKNNWFGSDRIMTRAAQAIHEELVLEEGFDPASDDYYKEIDSRMRKEMPQKFKEKRSNAQTVAPASGNGRSVKSGRKKSVELSPGQVAFAKKMRIPLDKYAREVAKIDNRRSE
jgi:pyruvate/2-oxoglutarate dehydrogenase complex dihydrolipoamide acyltransferase (E2) component|tara:strand:+ start:508 stop:1446 length:939 start_codon:yes stop_codon:yes gene_type:complete